MRCASLCGGAPPLREPAARGATRQKHVSSRCVFSFRMQVRCYRNAFPLFPQGVLSSISCSVPAAVGTGAGPVGSRQRVMQCLRHCRCTVPSCGLVRHCSKVLLSTLSAIAAGNAPSLPNVRNLFLLQFQRSVANVSGACAAPQTRSRHVSQPATTWSRCAQTPPTSRLLQRACSCRWHRWSP